MLHAVVRSEQSALHFYGEVSGYNVQTLRQHVRQALRDGSPVHLRLEILPADREAFGYYAGRWLRALRRSGAMVEVVASGDAPASAAVPREPRPSALGRAGALA